MKYPEKTNLYRKKIYGCLQLGWKWGLTANWHEGSFWSDGNVVNWIAVTIA